MKIKFVPHLKKTDGKPPTPPTIGKKNNAGGGLIFILKTKFENKFEQKLRKTHCRFGEMIQKLKMLNHS